MKKSTVNYNKFKPSLITRGEYSHLLLLLGWVIYLSLFVLTEKLILEEECHVIHNPIDDIIPFLEIFLIPYVFWYFLIVISLVYFLLCNVESFKRLQTYIIITQAVAIAIYIIFPSCQQLRPAELPRDNFLTDGVRLLYSIDTNTGVCPSLHCAYSFGIASVWLREKGVSRVWKAFVLCSVILICLSTMFIKQHSVNDFLAAIPLGILAEVSVFYVIPKITNKYPQARNRVG